MKKPIKHELLNIGGLYSTQCASMVDLRKDGQELRNVLLDDTIMKYKPTKIQG